MRRNRRIERPTVSELSTEERERLALDDLEFELQPKKTHEQIGQHIGVTRQRVHQIEARAIAKMRSLLKREGKGLDALFFGGPS